MKVEQLIDEYLKFQLNSNPNYTYNDAKKYIIEKIKQNNKNKLEYFNKDINNIPYDFNGIPKIIHFTLKDKNNIDNAVWRDCLQEYTKMYPDYKIILYDDSDIFNIIENFNKDKLSILKNIKKGAVLADIFRYLILYLRGGYYSDMDCFPYKRIDELSKTQYHGDNKNVVYICNKKYDILKPECEFYENPCTNCKMIYTAKNDNDRIVNIYKCLGHKYINEKKSILVGYEFEKTWHNELINSDQNKLWTDNNIGICQWFIGSKPGEKLFHKCYKNSIRNLINTDLNDKNNFHFNVINSTGPLFFTKMINEFLTSDKNFANKICMLPCDYFCCGSWNKVPSTKNKFIQHKFTGTWLK
jgi:mannosyltransferase OCH1-like enzyme